MEVLLQLINVVSNSAIGRGIVATGLMEREAVNANDIEVIERKYTATEICVGVQTSRKLLDKDTAGGRTCFAP